MLLLPGYLEPTLDPAIEDFIRDYNPDLIGIGLLSIEFYPSKNITKLLKENFEIPIIWGGVHVLLKPDECIQYADYICYGEGEKTIIYLLEHLRDKGREVPPEIPNLWANFRGEIIKKPEIIPEENLDGLPIQKYLPEYFYGLHKGEIYNFAQKPRLFRRYALYGGTCHMMITTRGCPFYCGYCANAYLMTVYGKKIRKRSVESCMEELMEVKKDPYVLYINFEDDWFFAHSKEWFIEFSREYKKHVNLPFMVRVFPSVIDREKLFLLKKAGLSLVIMGIQTGCDRVNFEVYNRKVSFSSVMKAAEIISESKVAPYYEMIVDNPYESEEDEMENINAMAKVRKPYTISLAHLTFFPGTALTERAVGEKRVDPDAYLTRYMVKIDKTYFNNLLYITPYIPRSLIRYLNKPHVNRTAIHILWTNILFFVVKRTVEPAVFLFIISRGLNYNIPWTVRTVLGNWRAAISKIFSNFLGKKDMEFDQRLALAKKTMPALFEKKENN
jgi:radical SAM superfamily enzyme YgiQ (UPF0313 family)